MDRHQYTSAGSPSDQAIEWLARLRAHDVTAQERADFATWLASSTLNKIAFDEASDLWHASRLISGQVSDQVVALAPQPQPFYTRSLPLAAAASVLFACVFMILQLTTPHFSTGKGEQRRILLSDGSTAFLNTDSALSVEFTNSERHIVIHQGEVWFNVIKNPDRPFVVAGEFATATAVGTAFTVRETPGFTRVGVTEGVVALAETSEAPIQLLSVGQQGTVSDALADVQEFDPENALAWQHGQLIYSNVRLDDLLADLSRYLPSTMVLNDKMLESTRISAVLHLDDQQAMLEALGKALPIRWKPVSEKLIIITSGS